MKKLIVGQSGGPTSVINSSLAGVYYEAKRVGFDKVYGMLNGIEGLLEDKIVDLDKYFKNKDNLELLKRTPSSFLGSCRYKLGSIKDNEKDYKKIFEILDKHKIDSLIYIGGNDSMDTVASLYDYAVANNKSQNFIGVPKTIDNDLPITDHCPGYGSASKYIATTLREIIQDNNVYGSTKPTISVVEIMGRHAGWLTAAASLAKGKDCEGVDAIYLPEYDFDIDEFLARIEKLRETKSSIVIAVSEGLKTKDGKFVCESGVSERKKDAFGHVQLSGCASTLADIVAQKTGLKTRAIEFSTIQRSASHLCSLTDVNEAESLGAAAVEAAHNGKTGVMSIIDGKGNISTYDIHEIANVEKKVPTEWYDNKKKQMKKPFLDYARPLIQGELTPIYKDGLPVHLVRK